MSQANDFAAAIAVQMSALSAAEALAPPPWNGQIMTATVNNDGSCQIVVQGHTYNVPAQLILAFATWTINTFGG